MKLIILHGSGLSGISSQLSSLKKDFDPLSIRELSGKVLSFNQVFVELSSASLFSDKRLIILEDFEEKIDLGNLPKDHDLTIVLKFQKNLNPASPLIKQAINLKALIYQMDEDKEISIFPFLDSLTYKNPNALSLLDKLYDEYGSQYIITMLYYMLRRLIAPPKKNSFFNFKVIEQGQKNFSLDSIRSLYKEIIALDFKIKTGVLDEKIGLDLLINRILTHGILEKINIR